MVCPFATIYSTKPPSPTGNERGCYNASMTQLTEHFRNDNPDGLPPEVKTFLDERYLAKLPELDISRPKLLVVFSGGNALGKTTLSRKIGAELHGLVLENDAIKECLLERYPKMDRDVRNKLTWQYTMDLYQRLPDITGNGLVVRDGLIDWYFDRILPIFERQGYPVFIIGYDVSREKNEQMIRTRGDKPTIGIERMLRLIDEQQIHMQRFRKFYTPDIMLTDNNLFDHDRVIDALTARLARLQQHPNL